jgi:hypothetical protein
MDAVHFSVDSDLPGAAHLMYLILRPQV